MGLARRISGPAALALAASACISTSPLTTGLEGYVSRGPITPVCVPSVPCDAPMAASFTVLRDGVPVAVFASDSTGQFQVALAPGTYRIVPSPDAPVIDPQSQTKDVTVGSDGYTHVNLSFDTGIR